MSKPEPFKWRKAKPAPTTPAPKAPSPPPAPVRAAAAAQGVARVPETPTAPARTLEAPRPSHDQIAARAYALWESRGWPHGEDREHWLEAERELTGMS